MNVSVYLLESVLSHEQLYIALSSETSRGNTDLLLNPKNKFKDDEVYTSNVVYTKVVHG